LTSPIIFTELKMKEQIGGGGFGQVWKATWRGTPVAVKVLAVSHKAEHIQKAILEEFAAEINMVSGMRHPNICLYIGACLEPSNRAIVTELASNGSLWDALRIPLRPPNVVADGKTRNVWPLNLYETTPSNSTSNGAELSPPVPFGTSPYFPIAPQGAW
jgi:serine/threonine protein kinase